MCIQAERRNEAWPTNGLMEVGEAVQQRSYRRTARLVSFHENDRPRAT
jgi:hypothetical protein